MRPSKSFLAKAMKKERNRLKLKPWSEGSTPIFDISGIMKKGAAANESERFSPPAENARREAEKTILAQRARLYSPSDAALRAVAAATGSAIRGVLMSHWQMSLPEIPPHILHLIMVQIKVIRAALPHGSNPDNFLDAHNYLELCEKIKEMDGLQPPTLTYSFSINPKHIKFEGPTTLDEEYGNVTNTDDRMQQGIRKKRKRSSKKGGARNPRGRKGRA
jgi:hypothetical protein